jgi:hypothetical protein
VFCALPKQIVFGSFFGERTVTGIVLEEFLMVILEEEGPDDLLFQQDGPRQRFHKELTEFLNRKFPEKWTVISEQG